MGDTVYYTTPIYYVNAEPHIGHLYTTVLVDTLKRFHKMMGDDVYFLTGTDEHGEKLAQVADKKGVAVEDLTAEVTETFKTTWQAIDIDNDDFIHTTEVRHKSFVQKILQQVYDAGDIYFDEYTGHYCVGCERYLTDTELEDGVCPDHKIAPKEVKEANYFFKMGKYQKQLIQHIQDNPDWIRPERFRNEVLSFLKQPLEDLCISRPKSRLTWGIELPFDKNFVTYVWFDALLNYVSGLKKTSDGKDIFNRYWPGCNHVVAKDILKTHAIYWPTMLMSAALHDKAPLPHRIDVHGYWLAGESKMSKSLGNVVRPLSFDAQFGIENLRYFFFREMKFGQDASFTYEVFVERYNADLANGLGNLLSRVSSIVKKNLGGSVPEKGAFGEDEKSIEAQAKGAVEAFPEHFKGRAFHKAIDDIRSLMAVTDKYINDKQPWRLAKEEGKEDELKLVLYTGLSVVRLVAYLLSPVMPKTCQRILAYLGDERPLDGSVPYAEMADYCSLKSGHELGDVPRAFPRIDEKKLNAVLKEAAKEAEQAQKALSEEKAAIEPIGEEITIDEFSKVDLRVGVVLEAGLVEGAKKLIRLLIDLGEERPRQVFAGLRAAYPEPEKLVGKKFIVVANLKPRKMKFGISEGMVLAGGGGTSRLEAAIFDGDVHPGDRVS